MFFFRDLACISPQGGTVHHTNKMQYSAATESVLVDFCRQHVQVNLRLSNHKHWIILRYQTVTQSVRQLKFTTSSRRGSFLHQISQKNRLYCNSTMLILLSARKKRLRYPISAKPGGKVRVRLSSSFWVSQNNCCPSCILVNHVYELMGQTPQG